MTSTELLRPLRSQAEAQADLAKRDSADPWWRFRWHRKRNPMPGLGVEGARRLAVHMGNAEPKSALQ